MVSGSARRYFLYAIGEVSLVIAGIVIALQIDNWNQERQEQEQIAEYARALTDDLQADIEMIEPIITQVMKIQSLSNGLNEYVRNRRIEDISNLDLFYLTSRTTYRPFAWNRAALQQLMNSGALRQMKNLELVREISNYEAFTRHLDEDFAGDVRMGEQAELAALDIVDQNYPSVEDYPEIMRWYAPYEFPPTVAYRRYRESQSHGESVRPCRPRRKQGKLGVPSGAGSGAEPDSIAAV